MAYPTKSSFIESYDDRLRRVEVAVQKSAVELAETNVKMEYLSRQVEDGHDKIGRQIEKSSDNLCKRIDAQSAASEKLATSINQNEGRIASLERSDEQNSNKIKWVKNVLTAALLALVGAVISKIVQGF